MKIILVLLILLAATPSVARAQSPVSGMSRQQYDAAAYTEQARVNNNATSARRVGRSSKYTYETPAAKAARRARGGYTEAPGGYRIDNRNDDLIKPDGTVVRATRETNLLPLPGGRTINKVTGDITRPDGTVIKGPRKSHLLPLPDGNFINELTGDITRPNGTMVSYGKR